jgi:hypothetical protein
LGRRILEKISRRQALKASTLLEYERRIEQYRVQHDREGHACHAIKHPETRTNGATLC